MYLYTYVPDDHDGDIHGDHVHPVHFGDLEESSL